MKYTTYIFLFNKVFNFLGKIRIKPITLKIQKDVYSANSNSFIIIQPSSKSRRIFASDSIL